MHHAVEQFGGRGTRDSFPKDGLTRVPWTPVGSRAWQPTARCSPGMNQHQLLSHLPPSPMGGLNHPSKFFSNGPMRGGEKLDLPQPMLPGLQREQQRPPHHHLHPPPPHRAWEQLGQLYESHLPPQGHPVPLPNEHSLRLHNGGYAGSGMPPPNPHLPPSRQNQLLKFGGPQEQHVPQGPPLLGDEMWAQVHQQRGYPGKMLGGQLKRPGPPLGEHSVIQHTPPPSLHPSSRPAAEDCPSPSKRKKSSDQVSHPGLQRFPGPSLISQHQSSAHHLPPKPAFWNPLHKNNSTPWQPQTSDRKNPPSQEFQVRTEINKQGMGSYTQKSSPAAPIPSKLSPPTNSSPGRYNQGCAPQLQKDTFQPPAVNQQSPHSSYPSPSSKLGLAPPCQAMESHGAHNQRGPLIGGQGGSQATSHTASTPTRGDRDQHLHAQSSPANPPATSNNNNSSSSSSGSVPYSHFQPHPGLGHQGPPPPPPPASSTSVPQQQQSGPHEAWRYQSRPSSHSLETGIYRPPGLLPQRQQSHSQFMDSRVPGPSQHHHHVSSPLPPTNSTRTPVITPNLPISQATCSIGGYSNSSSSRGVNVAGVSTLTTSPPAGCPVNNGSSNNSWQSGREPVSRPSTGTTSQLDALLQPGCQRGQTATANQPHQQGLPRPQQQGSTKSQPMKGKIYYAQAEMEQPPALSSSSLFSSGHQRAGDSVITSRASNPLSNSPTTYRPAPRSTVHSAPQPSSPALSSRLGHQPDSASTQAYSQPQIRPPAPTSAPQSIEEALDKLDAELEGHMQAEERRKRDRDERERKMREEERRKKEWEMRQKRDEERKRKELEKKEEERKKKELDRQEEERRRREWERQEQERKRRQEEERRRREAERLEEERKNKATHISNRTTHYGVPQVPAKTPIINALPLSNQRKQPAASSINFYQTTKAETTNISTFNSINRQGLSHRLSVHPAARGLSHPSRVNYQRIRRHSDSTTRHLLQREKKMTSETPPTISMALVNPQMSSVSADGKNPSTQQLSISVCAVLYSYKPRQPEELELKKGEMVGVYGKFKEGWLRGLSLRTGKVGILPSNYISPVLRTSARLLETKAGSASSQYNTVAGKKPTAAKNPAVVLALDRVNPDGKIYSTGQVPSVPNGAQHAMSSAGAGRPSLYEGAQGWDTVRRVFNPHRGSNHLSHTSNLNTPSNSQHFAQVQASGYSPALQRKKNSSILSNSGRPLGWMSEPAAPSAAAVFKDRDFTASHEATFQHDRQPSNGPHSILVRPDSHKNNTDKAAKSVRFLTDEDSPPPRRQTSSWSSGNQAPSNCRPGPPPLEVWAPSLTLGRDGPGIILKEGQVPILRKGLETTISDLNSNPQKLISSQPSLSAASAQFSPSRHRVTTTHLTQTDSELSLLQGELVLVHRPRSDGRVLVTQESSGRTGLFHSSILQALERLS